MTRRRGAAYLAAGEFPQGSMGPKIEAAIDFLERGGRRSSSRHPISLADARWPGETGTRRPAS